MTGFCFDNGNLLIYSKFYLFFNESKKILVPLDGSETSLHLMKSTIDLSKQCNASIIGLHVITDLSLFTAAQLLL